MITEFEWVPRFQYDTKLVRFKVMRVIYPKARWAHKAEDAGKRHYKLLATDMAGVDWAICTFTTQGPLTNEERKHVIDMAPYHPTMGVHYGKRD